MKCELGYLTIDLISSKHVILVYLLNQQRSKFFKRHTLYPKTVNKSHMFLSTGYINIQLYLNSLTLIVIMIALPSCKKLSHMKYNNSMILMKLTPKNNAKAPPTDTETNQITYVSIILPSFFVLLFYTDTQ